MSSVERKDYGGIVNWCDTDLYRSCVKFVHPKHKTDTHKGFGVSMIVMAGRLKLYRIDNLN